jgi:hypothetical protein
VHVTGNGPELGEVLQFADYRIRAAVEFVWCHRQSFQQRESYGLVSRATEAESRRHLPGHRQFATERLESDLRISILRHVLGSRRPRIPPRIWPSLNKTAILPKTGQDLESSSEGVSLRRSSGSNGSVQRWRDDPFTPLATILVRKPKLAISPCASVASILCQQTVRPSWTAAAQDCVQMSTNRKGDPKAALCVVSSWG